jgi:hypothetical protein
MLIKLATLYFKAIPEASGTYIATLQTNNHQSQVYLKQHPFFARDETFRYALTAQHKNCR